MDIADKVIGPFYTKKRKSARTGVEYCTTPQVGVFLSELREVSAHSTVIPKSIAMPFTA